MIRLMGNAKPEFLIAALTRSRDSCTAVSGRPTIVKHGIPGEISTSTSIIEPDRPTVAQDLTLANVVYLPGAWLLLEYCTLA